MDLLTAVSDKFATTFNRTCATLPVTLYISKDIYRVWHAGLFHKVKSYVISSGLFSLVMSFLSEREL